MDLVDWMDWVDEGRCGRGGEVLLWFGSLGSSTSVLADAVKAFGEPAFALEGGRERDELAVE